MCDCCCDLWNMVKGLSISSIANILVAITSVVALVLSGKSYLRENENRKKDIELQQWNALYPHRLNFYTDFFKTYNQFVQSQLLDLKWDTDLREKFIQVLKLEGNKDE